MRKGSLLFGLAGILLSANACAPTQGRVDTVAPIEYEQRDGGEEFYTILEKLDSTITDYSASVPRFKYSQSDEGNLPGTSRILRDVDSFLTNLREKKLNPLEEAYAKVASREIMRLLPSHMTAWKQMIEAWPGEVYDPENPDTPFSNYDAFREMIAETQRIEKSIGIHSDILGSVARMNDQE